MKILAIIFFALWVIVPIVVVLRKPKYEGYTNYEHSGPLTSENFWDTPFKDFFAITCLFTGIGFISGAVNAIKENNIDPIIWQTLLGAALVPLFCISIFIQVRFPRFFSSILALSGIALLIWFLSI